MVGAVGRRRVGASALAVALTALGLSAPAPGVAAGSDPLCLGSYGGAPPRVGAPLRFGIDPGLSGSIGGIQLPAVPDNPTRDLAAVKALAPKGRVMVVRLNRLFWSAGEQGIEQFQQLADSYTQAGFDVEIQVRYHPPTGEAGDMTAWEQYVRHVVDVFGPNRRVVAMTITNEVNVSFSPNTSDGYYAGAEDALIDGIETAHAEALRRGFDQLRFGFTYAYRFVPTSDTAFFSYIGAHGGKAFRQALGFVGLAASRHRPEHAGLDHRERRSHRAADRRPAGSRARATRLGRARLLRHLQRHRLPLVQPARLRLERARDASRRDVRVRWAAGLRLQPEAVLLRVPIADRCVRPAHADAGAA